MTANATHRSNRAGTPRPLPRIRVIDFCWVLAGPLGTRILANFGAEVIRVESLARRDGFRTPPHASARTRWTSATGSTTSTSGSVR